jgi:hypothetical protein
LDKATKALLQGYMQKAEKSWKLLPNSYTLKIMKMLFLDGVSISP